MDCTAWIILLRNIPLRNIPLRIIPQGIIPQASPPFGKEGCPKGGVVGRDKVYSLFLYFSYHLPLRGLLLPEGGEAMQDACET